MASQGPQNPSASSGPGWSNLNGVFISDGLSASNTGGYQTTFTLVASAFGFVLPSVSPITGVLVEIQARESADDMRLEKVELLRNGTVIGVDTTETLLVANDIYYTRGGSTALWQSAGGLTASAVNDSTFATQITFRNQSASIQTVYVNHVRMTVYYTPASNPQFVVGSTVNYGAGARLGPNNSPSTLSFTVSDAEETGVNALSYQLRTATNGSGIMVGSGTATSGQSRSHSISYNAPGLDGNGDQTLYLRVLDGQGGVIEQSFPLSQDAIAPTVSGLSYSPVPVINDQTYTLRFTPTDQIARNPGELIWVVSGQRYVFVEPPAPVDPTPEPVPDPPPVGTGTAMLGMESTMISVAGSDQPTAIKNRANYVCTGADDQIVINEAIAAAGVQAVYLVGSFNQSAPVVVNKAGFHLTGAGASGSAQLNAQSTFPTGRAQIEVAQTTAYRDNIWISNLRISGNKGSQGTKTIHGIAMASYRGRIENVDVVNANGYGIHIDCPQDAAGKRVNKMTDGIIRNCQVGYCRDLGIRGNDVASEDMHLTNCVIMHIGKTGTTPIDNGQNNRHAVSWSGASAQFVDFHCYGNTGAGFYFQGRCARTKLTNCKIEMNNGGLIMAPSGVADHIYNGLGFRGGNGPQVRIAGGSNESTLAMTGCVFAGDNNNGPSATKAIELDAGCRNSVFVGNRFGWGYTTTPIIVGGNASNVFSGNFGSPV